MTLIELLVTVAVLSIVLTITTFSLAGKKRQAADGSSITTQLRTLRSTAITSGVAQTATLRDSASAIFVTALPDGRVVSDMPNLDRLAGAARKGDAR